MHSCGHPRSLAFEDFNEGMFEMREAKCQACAAIDLYRRSQEGRAHEPGNTAGVVNLLAPGDDFRRWRGNAKSADEAGADVAGVAVSVGGGTDPGGADLGTEGVLGVDTAPNGVPVS